MYIEYPLTEKERNALIIVLEAALDSFDFSGDEDAYLQERVTKKLLKYLKSRPGHIKHL